MAFTIGDIISAAFSANESKFRDLGEICASGIKNSAIYTSNNFINNPIINKETKSMNLPMIVSSSTELPVLDLKPVDGSVNYSEYKEPANPILLDPNKPIPKSTSKIKIHDFYVSTDDQQAYLSNYFRFGPGSVLDDAHGNTLRNAYEIICVRLQTEKPVYDAFAGFINSFNPTADPARKLQVNEIKPYEFVTFTYKDDSHEYTIKVHTGSEVGLIKDVNGVVTGAINQIQFIKK